MSALTRLDFFGNGTRRMTLTYTIRTITPEIAAEWLATNHNNRSLMPNKIAQFAQAMRLNEWDVTHQGIAFDENGDLLDGQHRLHAVIKAGIPVDMLVIRGARRDTFAKIDTGGPRHPGTWFQMAGYLNGNAVAAAARLWICLEDQAAPRRFDLACQRADSQGFFTSPRDLFECIEANPDLYERACEAKASHDKRLWSPRDAAVFWAWTRKTHGSDMADRFYWDLVRGANLSADDAVFLTREACHALYDRAQRDRAPSSAFRTQRRALICKAWNMHLRGKRGGRSKIVWRSTEEFPVLE